MNKTSPPPARTASAPSATISVPPVLKCRCGGLYLNADAHRDAFGHRPEPVSV